MVPVWFRITPNMNARNNSLYFVHFANRSPSFCMWILAWFKVVPQLDASINQRFSNSLGRFRSWFRMVQDGSSVVRGYSEHERERVRGRDRDRDRGTVRKVFLWLNAACVQFYFCESGNKYKLFVNVF